MASKKIKAGIYSFLTVLLCTVFIISFSFGGSYAYEAFNPTEELIAKETIVSSISIGQLTIEEAKGLIEQETDKWRETNTVSFHYMDKETTKGANQLYSFDSSTSVQLAINDLVASLFVVINSSEVDEMIEQLSDEDLLEKIDTDLLVEHLTLFAQNLEKGPLHINIHSYFLEEHSQEEGVISEGYIHNLSSTNDLYEIIRNLNGYEIKAKTETSLLQILEDFSLENINQEAMSIAASAIYKIILETNFEIMERHLSNELPLYSELGHEAFVSNNGHDLRFYNPNILPYTLELSLQSNLLHASLRGLPFDYKYRIKLDDEQVFEPKRVLRYSPQLPIGDRVIEQDGKSGYGINVYRESLDKANRVVAKELVSEDFYRPTHIIEIRSLIAPEQPTLPGDSNPGIPNPNNGQDGNSPPTDTNQPPGNGEDGDKDDQDNPNNDGRKEDEGSEPIKGY